MKYKKGMRLKLKENISMNKCMSEYLKMIQLLHTTKDLNSVVIEKMYEKDCIISVHSRPFETYRLQLDFIELDKYFEEFNTKPKKQDLEKDLVLNEKQLCL